MAVEVGAIVDGTVAKLADFGVFVRLPNGETGLVHISEIADAYVNSVADYFSEGDAVKVKVLNIKEGGRYELSAKQAEKREPIPGRLPDPPPARGGNRRDDSGSFEDRLTDFMKTSEQRLAVLRRNRDTKRRKRGRR
jgi:S1 RNA binding domain protein